MLRPAARTALAVVAVAALAAVVLAACARHGRGAEVTTAASLTAAREATVRETAEPVAAEPISAHSAVTPDPDALFATTVRPILEARCQPCHFTGGVMYQRRPFDRAQTVRDLGERLFTRIHDPAEQETIRAFLATKEN